MRKMGKLTFLHVFLCVVVLRKKDGGGLVEDESYMFLGVGSCWSDFPKTVSCLHGIQVSAEQQSWC